MYDDVEYSTTVGLRIRLLMYNIKNLHDVYLKSRYCKESYICFFKFYVSVYKINKI